MTLCKNIHELFCRMYDCLFLQVSTPTGSVSHYYNLGIIVPRAYILGADEYVVNNISIIIIIIIINNIFIIIDIIIIIFIIFTTWTSLSQELTSLEPMSMSGHQWETILDWYK